MSLPKPKDADLLRVIAVVHHGKIAQGQQDLFAISRAGRAELQAMNSMSSSGS
jgi:hypothetical protein